MELAEAKDAHAQLVDISAQPKADATKARADLESCKTRLIKVEQATKLASARPDDARKQSGESAETAEEVIRQ